MHVEKCEAIKSTDEVLLLGNRNAVKSRTIMACPRDKFPEIPGEIGTWPIRGVCESTGRWTLPRLICKSYENICHEYLVGPETRQKTMEWSTVLVHDVMLVSGPCGVPDHKMTSSSTFIGSRYTFWPYWAKFDFQQDTWVTTPDDEHAYLQVEFDRVTEVKGVRIRGRRYFEYEQYPTLFNITYGTDCTLDIFNAFVPNETGGVNFAGNIDSTGIVEHMFDIPIDALCVRVNIIDYVTTFTPRPNYFGMKLEFIGTVKLPTL